jgi:DNA-binding IclR family transcriptional regulator
VIQSIDRAANVLFSLERGRRMGIKELAEELGLPPSTVHGIVSSLQKRDFVTKEPYGNRYMLGPALVKLSNAYLDSNEVRGAAIPWTRELASRTGMSVRLGIELFPEVFLIHHDYRPDGTHQMRETGLTLPTHASALGKVLMAYNPTLADKIIERGLVPLTADTIVDEEALRADLREVAASGLGLERDEGVLGESSVAAPIADRSDSIVAAVSIVFPTSTALPTDSQLNDLRETGRNISRALGCSTLSTPA